MFKRLLLEPLDPFCSHVNNQDNIWPVEMCSIAFSSLPLNHSHMRVICSSIPHEQLVYSAWLIMIAIYHGWIHQLFTMILEYHDCYKYCFNIYHGCVCNCYMIVTWLLCGSCINAIYTMVHDCVPCYFPWFTVHLSGLAAKLLFLRLLGCQRMCDRLKLQVLYTYVCTNIGTCAYVDIY